MRAAVRRRTWAQEMVFAALSLSLALVLPMLTGQIPRLGAMLCPMHLPVLLAGFLCGPLWAAAVGATAPLLRSALFALPQLMPTALAMSVELMVYGLAAGWLWRGMRSRRGGVIAALLGAMLAGRMAWGAAAWALYGALGMAFDRQIFFAAAFVQTLPGVAVQMVLIPPTVTALRRLRVIE